MKNIFGCPGKDGCVEIARMNLLHHKSGEESGPVTLLLFFSSFIVAPRAASRRDERGIRRRTKERAKKIRVERRRPAWGIGTIPGRKRRMQEARHGNNKIICHWPICIRRSRVPWRQACKVQLNEPSLNIVWKITSVTRILLPPPLLPARLSLSFKWILLARHAWLVDSFLLLFLFFFLGEVLVGKEKAGWKAGNYYTCQSDCTFYWISHNARGKYVDQSRVFRFKSL